MVGLRLFTERVGDGAGQPDLDTANGEELVHVQSGVSIVLGNRAPESPGTLYITTKKVVWLSDSDRSKGYAVDFLSVSLHAVTRDPEAYSAPCLYTQIETGAEDDESEESDSDETVDISKITEMRLVPSDPNQLDTLFQVFCECAELNPEPVAEDEGGDSWIFSADQMDHDAAADEETEWTVPQNPSHSIGSFNGDHDLAHGVVQLQINDQRFEDAEIDNDDKSHA